jgi:hypothetical protein
MALLQRAAPGQLYEIYDMSTQELQAELAHARVVPGAMAEAGWRRWACSIEDELREQGAAVDVLSAIVQRQDDDRAAEAGAAAGGHEAPTAAAARGSPARASHDAPGDRAHAGAAGSALSARPPPPLPGAASALRILHSKSVLCGDVVWYGRAAA